MTATTDEDLQQQFLKNPEQAFRAVYDRYASPLFRFIFRFTANNEQSEEILHDIFTQLLSGKFRPHADTHLKSWLYTLAKNKSLNHMKKSTFEIRDPSLLELAPSEVDLESATINDGLLQKLSRAEETLSPDLQQTWSLRKQGLDNQQIADQLSIPVGTVKSRFHRLVEYLKEEFKNEPSN
jgi:RNA polymerase sigma-70 factor (ECF subfamily)